MASMINPVGSEMTLPQVPGFGSTAPGDHPPVKAAAAARPVPDSRDAGTIVKELNDAVQIINTNLSFSVDEPTGKTVIKVINADTKEVIRQIPPEDMLRVAARIKDLLGVLFDKSR